MTEGGIRLSDVHKSYARGASPVGIFQGLSLTIDAGDFVAVMGPSGSGKTTLLNLLGGLDTCDSGGISVGGTHLDGLSEASLSAWRAAEVGFVFQFYHLIAAMTAADNVEIPLLLTRLGARERSRRVRTALDVVGLANRSGHRPRQLSGGEQQRVIARAIVADPRLLLADEPTGDLDRDSATVILDMLKTLNARSNKTIVMVTHDPEAARYAKRTLHLDKGTLIEA